MNSFENIEDRDPFILLSIINLKLRDFYSSLDDLCGDLDISKEKLENKLHSINYVFNIETNQFIAK